MIQKIFLLLLIYISTIVAHEFGHYIAFKKNILIRIGKQSGKFRITTGQEKDYVGLSKKQRLHIYFNGIISGFFVLVFGAILFSDYSIEIGILALYYLWFGCKTDFNNIERLKHGKGHN